MKPFRFAEKPYAGFRISRISAVSGGLVPRGTVREEMYSVIAKGWVTGSKVLPFDFRTTHFTREAENGHWEVESYNGHDVKPMYVRLITGRPSRPLRSARAGHELAATFTRNELRRTKARRGP